MCQLSKFGVIGYTIAEISQIFDFQMVAVHHLGFFKYGNFIG